eukprot:3479945-Prymnesium_polylepis.1
MRTCTRARCAVPAGETIVSGRVREAGQFGTGEGSDAQCRAQEAVDQGAARASTLSAAPTPTAKLRSRHAAEEAA